MNTAEWISRNVAKLLPAANSIEKMATTPIANARAAVSLAPAPAPTGPIASATSRSLPERLAGSLRHKDEALSPRLLRRILTELQAILDNQVSEVEGGRRASEFAQWYGAALPAQRRDCWLLMSEQFAPDPDLIEAARSHYTAAQNTLDAGQAEIRLRQALVSPRSRLLQRFAAFPEGMQFLLDLRTDLLAHLKSEKRLLALDGELEHLFSGWFDVAFLELRRISWDSPASLIEKLIKYEAVHDIRDWNDVKNRLDADRRCYGFFHPQLPNEPLIFVEVALLDKLPCAISPLLDEAAAPADLSKASTAIFYSISSTQSGLRGVSFGDSLIKRVVETLKVEFPRLRTFATLSPIPGFRSWLGKNASAMLARLDVKARAALASAVGAEPITPAHLLTAAEQAQTLDAQSPLRHFLMQCAAHYLGRELVQGKPLDPVTRFHLGNGARIERLNWGGDFSSKGVKQSYGMMVNYLYDLKRLDRYRAQFANSKLAVSSEIETLGF
ncbi:MAG: malonyl-CoA decarboxylase [Gammaproteobacteria bacterium]|uniref:malonyl-CoA decarboxylase n=1 Tax=Rhodoferax sp. TaxID=50421 RepID=UPI00181F788D|nr:malonyl-CoA decarboxylase [Rhodoferax sp.]MBU3899088.1 malonyl-CoA decarboxylase [Gammaproteobacteria bacterium]MBA3057612.1 malonyl-CoA decarboxylase [Rhodoferax sp.]MBU3997648.1 malonyl-CoA decarboxylase [Gammaproteobacteria bacterium]MBU4018532.1 malonyl-CoA decarboxylase [Gammaproteobacteria bacterium]MBU4080544.1 malonyl-CoA decarboxylase [Gammaproteobacteria bacterium]